MQAKTLDILNDPRLLQARAYHIDRLTALYEGQRLDDIFYLRGYNGVAQADPYWGASHRRGRGCPRYLTWAIRLSGDACQRPSHE